MGPKACVTLMNKFAIKVTVPENPRDGNFTKALFEESAKAMKLAMKKNEATNAEIEASH